MVPAEQTEQLSPLVGHQAPSMALGLLGLVVGLSKVPALTHGVVLSALPDTVARVEVALTLWTSVAATALGLVLFADVLE